MRVPIGRRGAALTALAVVLILGASGSAALAAPAPAGLTRFMAAVGSVESGGNYTARNPVSGAYGKYQIMPSNWPSWARQYVGNARAPWTPRNQDRVAAGKMSGLYRWLGSWRRVAYWWLTGSDRRTGWSTAAQRYVAKVMTRYSGGTVGTTKPKAKATSTKTYTERSGAIAYTGSWKIAKHRGYSGDAVAYATKSGATATFTFTGRTVRWNGPVGPTRGKAKIYIDGKLVKTVDLRRGTFDARATLFRTSWKSKGTHTLKIVVVGTRGRPMVAVDDFSVSQ